MRKSVVTRKSDFFVRTSDYFFTPAPDSNNDISESVDSENLPYFRTPNYSLSNIKIRQTEANKNEENTIKQASSSGKIEEDYLEIIDGEMNSLGNIKRTIPHKIARC